MKQMLKYHQHPDRLSKDTGWKETMFAKEEALMHLSGQFLHLLSFSRKGACFLP